MPMPHARGGDGSKSQKGRPPADEQSQKKHHAPKGAAPCAFPWPAAAQWPPRDGHANSRCRAPTKIPRGGAQARRCWQVADKKFRRFLQLLSGLTLSIAGDELVEHQVSLTLFFDLKWRHSWEYAVERAGQQSSGKVPRPKSFMMKQLEEQRQLAESTTDDVVTKEQMNAMWAKMKARSAAYRVAIYPPVQSAEHPQARATRKLHFPPRAKQQNRSAPTPPRS